MIGMEDILEAMYQINTLRPRQNGPLFTDIIFKYIFLNEIYCIFIRNSQKYVPRGPIISIPALVQMMAWHPTGAKPLSEQMLA